MQSEKRDPAKLGGVPPSTPVILALGRPRQENCLGPCSELQARLSHTERNLIRAEAGGEGARGREQGGREQ